MQGVGYRRSVLQAAQQFNLNEWVRNLSDTIEAVFEENASDREQVLGWCRQEKPMAVVQNFAVKQETRESIQSFEIRHS